MATIIDSLIVRFGLDTSDFTRNKKSVDGGLDETRKKVGAADRGFRDLSGSASKFLAVIGGVAAIKMFVETTIESSAAIYRLSQNLNVAVEKLSAWSNAAALAGGSGQGLQATMSMLSRAQTELQLTGQSGLVPYFSALGVALSDVEGKARPANDILLDLAERFEGMERSKANNIGLMMGIDQGTLNAMLEGRKSLELTIKRQQEFSVVSKRQGEEAVRLQRAFRQTKIELTAFGRELLSEATPGLEKLLSAFNGVSTWVLSNKELIIDFLKALGIGLAVIAAATIPINLTAAAIVGLAGAFALLKNDFEVWKRGGDSLFNWEGWEPSIKKAIGWLKQLGSAFVDVMYVAVAGGDAIWKAATGDFAGAKIAAKAFWEGRQQESTPGTTASNQQQPAATAGGRNLPRGIRNNNPGNLNFARQSGATKEGGANGRFAVFGSMQEGVAALVRQLGLYMKRGKNTLRKILETYAPPSENNTGAYINTVAKKLGIDPDQPLNPQDSQQIMSLVKAISAHENGGNYLSDADVMAGYNLARGNGKGGAGNTSNNTTTIGEIKVYTQATDAKGVADGMKDSMNNLFTSQAAYGAF